MHACDEHRKHVSAASIERDDDRAGCATVLDRSVVLMTDRHIHSHRSMTIDEQAEAGPHPTSMHACLV
jgi:hypothetical protein